MVDEGLPPSRLCKVILDAGKGGCETLIVTLLKDELVPEQVLDIGCHRHTPEVLH